MKTQLEYLNSNIKNKISKEFNKLKSLRITPGFFGRPSESCFEHLLSWVDQIRKVYQQQDE